MLARGRQQAPLCPVLLGCEICGSRLSTTLGPLAAQISGG